jgi:hypothetical protein
MVISSAFSKQGRTTHKEELSDDDLIDTGLVMQCRFYIPCGKREAIEKSPCITQLPRAHQGKKCSLTIKCIRQ